VHHCVVGLRDLLSREAAETKNALFERWRILGVHQIHGQHYEVRLLDR
jgi:hypothetical protein